MQLLKLSHSDLPSSQRKEGNMISLQIHSVHRLRTPDWTINRFFWSLSMKPGVQVFRLYFFRVLIFKLQVPREKIPMLVSENQCQMLWQSSKCNISIIFFLVWKKNCSHQDLHLYGDPLHTYGEVGWRRLWIDAKFSLEYCFLDIGAFKCSVFYVLGQWISTLAHIRMTESFEQH